MQEEREAPPDHHCGQHSERRDQSAKTIDVADYIQRAKDNLFFGQKLFDKAILDHGKGAYLYDTEGKEYLDFVAGIAVTSLGHCHEAFTQALKAQLDKGTQFCNYYYNVPAIEAAEKIVKASKLSKVFFCNSGTEGNEGALKVAKKYAATRNKPVNAAGEYEVISMSHSFHGRTMGSLGATNNPAYQSVFVPKIACAREAEFNNLESVKALVTDSTCAILTEVLQGEGGIIEGKKEFFQGLRQLCDEKDILLIFDEVQCGMGRLGSLFAHDLYGVKPDVLVLAKALGGGIPVGAFVVAKKLDGILSRSEHGNTYGLNPFSCAAVNAVFDIYEKENLVEHARVMGEYLKGKIQTLVDKYDFALEQRGLGLMQGLKVSVDITDVELRAFDKGLLIIGAGPEVIRFIPALIVTEKEIDRCIDILDEIFAEIAAERH